MTLADQGVDRRAPVLRLDESHPVLVAQVPQLFVDARRRALLRERQVVKKDS